MSNLDLTTVNKYTEKIKIASLKPRGGGSIMVLNIEGVRGQVLYWAKEASKFAVSPAEGAEAVAEIDVREEVVKAGQRAGEKIIEAWLLSFGGPNKGGGKPLFQGGGKSYTPKTPEEIHAPSIAGIVKSCVESAQSLNDFEPIVDAALKAYQRGLAMVCGPSSQPIKAAAQQTVKAPAAPPEPAAAPKQGVEQGAWFRSIGGTADQFALLSRYCKLKEIAWWDVLDEAKNGNCTDPAEIVASVRPASFGTEEDPAHGLSGAEAREAYYVIAKEFDWPTPAAAPLVCSVVFAGWLNGKRVTEFQRLTDADWLDIYRGAHAARATNSEPNGFTRWKSENLVAGHSPNHPNGS